MNNQGNQVQYDFRSYTTNKSIKEIDMQKTEIDIKKGQKIANKITEKKFKNVEILQQNFEIFFKNEQRIDFTLLNNFLHDKYILSGNSSDTKKKIF